MYHQQSWEHSWLPLSTHTVWYNRSKSITQTEVHRDHVISSIITTTPMELHRFLCHQSNFIPTSLHVGHIMHGPNTDAGMWLNVLFSSPLHYGQYEAKHATSHVNHSSTKTRRAMRSIFSLSDQNDDAGLLRASIEDGFNSPIWREIICCVHVIFAVITESTMHEVDEAWMSTWMLQEISESSSNRIVQRTSWSKERMLGLRNRSIFILLSIQFQLLMSADPRAAADAHVDSTYRLHTRRTHMHMYVR